MKRIVLDEAVLSKLTTSRELIEICDSQGRIRGFFQTHQDGETISLEPEIPEEEMERREKLPLHGRTTEEIISKWDISQELGLSEEELQRRLKQPGRPLAEILRDLEKRWPTES